MYMWRYFVGLFLTIGLIILLIVLLVGGGNDSGTSDSNKAKVPITKKELISYANTGTEARLTIDGPINSVQEHKQAKITVSRTNTVYEQVTGYNGQVAKMYNFKNTENSFSAFLHGLAAVGFTQGDTTTENQDEDGYCPKGKRYVLELNNGSKNIQRFWATSCGGDLKTYQGELENTLDLFRAQVPEYNKLNNDFEL